MGIIYLAVNRVNGKQYVGKTSRDFSVRIREHIYDSRNKAFQPFHRAIAKYGLNSFDVAVLESCGPREIDQRERYWIGMIRCQKPHGYNMTSGGEGTPGIKRPDVSARLSAMTGQRNHAFGRVYTEQERKSFGQPGIRNARFGVKLTPEFKSLISERTRAAMARPDVRERFMAKVAKSPETRRKLSIAQKRFQEQKRRNNNALAR